MDNIVRGRRTTINKITFGLFLALTTQGYSQRVNAETAVKSSHEHDLVLDELKVEGTSNAHEGDWVYDELHSVSEISREQLDNRPARHAADILEQTSGVYSSVSQQDPALSVNIRGIQDYGRVNMNIDGMRQNFMKSGHGQRNGVMYIDPEILDNVVIERGATNGIGSVGTIGGIVTFNTFNAREFLASGKGIGGRVRAMSGTNGTQFIGSSVLALGNERGDLLLAVSERNLKEYWPGRRGNLGIIRLGAGFGTENIEVHELIKKKKVSFTDYKIHSQIAKLGWNISADQRLMLSYLQAQIHSPNAGMFTTLRNTKGVGTVEEYGWVSSSVSDVKNRNIGLDYSLKPEHIPWLNLAAKIYYVDTDDQTDTHNSDSVNRRKFWTQTQLATHGLQLQNTSLFTPADQHQLALRYGLEWFSDRSRGNTTNNYLGGLLPAGQSAHGLTPPGKRAMTSTFAQLNYNYSDWLRLEGGLRYDQFHLQGSTWLLTRSYIAEYTALNPCDRNRPNILEQVYEAKDRCSSNRHSIMVWDVDRREQRFSPTAALGIKPGVQWLEFFGTYGKSWRPPAITEALASGTSNGHAWNLPNPFLASERSKAWEAGFNIQQQNLFIDEDRLVAKVAYFDTRVANYINLELAKQPPKMGWPDFSKAAYINNLLSTRFRGLEYQLSYDVGVFYINANYTRMIGLNSLCSRHAWLGGVHKFQRDSQRRVYSIEDERRSNIINCMPASNIFGSSAYLPGDRGSLTLGGRIFDKKLDIGTIIRYNKGHQDYAALDPLKSTNSHGHGIVAHIADWPKYTVFDLYASYELTNNLTLRSSIDNITDRAYVVSYGDSLATSPSRGRTIQGGFEYRF